MSDKPKAADVTQQETPKNFEGAYALGRTHEATLGTVHRVEEGGKPFVIIETGRVQPWDVEEFAAAPSRIKQTVTTSDADSFIRYVNDFKLSNSRIFAQFGDIGGSFRAILDYHEDPKSPRWGSHIATYNCPTTPEWNLWIGNNAKQISQVDFSDFVEKLRLSFKEPDVATMLEIARTLEASQTGKFESVINPQNGNRTLVYKDEVNASAGGSAKIAIPSTITLLLQPFRRGSMYQVESRLSYRIRDGKVTFQYDLVRAHEVVETALKEISVDVEAKTGIQPYNGTL